MRRATVLDFCQSPCLALTGVKRFNSDIVYYQVQLCELSQARYHLGYLFRKRILSDTSERACSYELCCLLMILKHCLKLNIAQACGGM